MEEPLGEWASALRPTWLEIDLGALARNYRRVVGLVAPRRVWCVVKADAYGHGAVEVSRRLQAEGADAFAVATVDEGLRIREAGISGRILVMAGIDPVEAAGSVAAARAAVEHRFEVAVWRLESAATLRSAAIETGNDDVRVHLKVDTGMGRLGVTVGDSVDDAVALAAAIADLNRVHLEGVFSNLAAADAPAGAHGHAHTVVQIERFGRFCHELGERGLLPSERHLGNSAGLLRHETSWSSPWGTGVRPGLLLFGVSPFEEDASIALEPVMSWHSVVAAVRRVAAGWPLGYGAVRNAAGECTIAVVPVGYHDGFPRALSDRAEVMVGGRRAKVVGAISMDLTLVDITGIPDVSPGDPVVLLGTSAGNAAASVDARELARGADSIVHEILCRVGARVPHRYVDRHR